jgi:hypothetical protein
MIAMRLSAANVVGLHHAVLPIWRAANDSPAIWRMVLRVPKLGIITTLEQFLNFPGGETALNVLLVLIVPDEAFDPKGHPPSPVL